MIPIQDNNQSTGICPLCHEAFPGDQLRAHIAAERTEIIRYTLQKIHAIHPQWREDDGACERCWEFYEQLGRFVSAPATMPQEAAVS